MSSYRPALVHTSISSLTCTHARTHTDAQLGSFKQLCKHSVLSLFPTGDFSLFRTLNQWHLHASQLHNTVRPVESWVNSCGVMEKLLYHSFQLDGPRSVLTAQRKLLPDSQQSNSPAGWTRDCVWRLVLRLSEWESEREREIVTRQVYHEIKGGETECVRRSGSSIGLLSSVNEAICDSALPP